jgi:hypothetical protein
MARQEKGEARYRSWTLSRLGKQALNKPERERLSGDHAPAEDCRETCQAVLQGEWRCEPCWAHGSRMAEGKRENADTDVREVGPSGVDTHE